jgi:hypothetical protein
MRKCSNCESRNAMSRFEDETFTVTHGRADAMVERLSGWRCDSYGEDDLANRLFAEIPRDVPFESLPICWAFSHGAQGRRRPMPSAGHSKTGCAKARTIAS